MVARTGADGERREPAWYFNKVPESKQAKNRVQELHRLWLRFTARTVDV
jgi:hypothetical protein